MLMPNAQLAQLIGGLLSPLFIMMSGLQITPSNITPFWLWLYWISPVRYVLEALAVTVFYCEGCPKSPTHEQALQQVSMHACNVRMPCHVCERGREETTTQQFLSLPSLDIISPLRLASDRKHKHTNVQTYKHTNAQKCMNIYAGVVPFELPFHGDDVS